jgi:hypothetical protein
VTEPKNPEPASLKDSDAPSGTWPGVVPGSGESVTLDLRPGPAADAPVDPAVPDGAIDPNQLASAGPEGAPQPVPREDDPGINANVIS